LTDFNQFEFIRVLTKAIQDINSDPKLNAIDKRDTIKALAGAPKEQMYEYLKTEYRTGPDISNYVLNFISPDRVKKLKKQGLARGK